MSPHRIYGSAWDALTEEQRAALALIAVDVAEDDQIDANEVQILYRGLPIHALAASPDPRLSGPALAAIVAIDKAARAMIEPFELRERISEMDEEALATFASIAERKKDDDGDVDWLPFESWQPIRPGETRRFMANPVEIFFARRLAVAMHQEHARHLILTMSCANEIILDHATADAFLVRVPEDQSEPIERGARIRQAKIYPSVPMLLDVENQSIAGITLRAMLRGGYPGRPSGRHYPAEMAMM